MKVIMVYSEAGGVTKTTTAVSLAMVSAAAGNSTTLIDLDPRGAATKWVGSYPDESWKHVGAILADSNPEGWADDLAIPTEWSERLRILPSARSLSNREKDYEDHAELRLAVALEGHSSNVVVIDCPNRQGGLLTQNALAASTLVVYAATANQDGLDGVEGARESVQKFRASREKIGATVNLHEAGIVVGAVKDTVMTKVSTKALELLHETGLQLSPIIPNRTIVDQSRMTGEWYGKFDKGSPVLAAYQQVFSKIIN
ncbi:MULTISPECIES: ParA family protein [Nocardiaceae]|uniref:ParA family protein n=1 Tax=Nocardiaceae TaxID=85025 RepID=UPI00050C1B97|nr:MULTISPECIES: ParA family protein [Rhodococcus]OZF41341.1 ParA family protein [Rhodococcus sp. 14-2470-1a]OZF41342.1 ParA family protein [Rhodococcus sp. 14-2470-1a]